MIGAIIGDIAGSRFEHQNRRTKDFTIFHENSRPTDDSVISLAVAKAILECHGNYEELSSKAVSCMQELGRKYKNAGYGGTFIQWIWSTDPKPYGSYGNGAAMRVGPCGFAAKSIDEAKELSEAVTRITHDHPEGLKGAEAVAVSVFLARTGKSKDEIKAYIADNYYDINFTLDEIRPTYKFNVSCQGSVPVALEAFFESNDFEDAIRNAVSVGGDSDTIAAITGAIAEAYYGVPSDFIEEAIEYLYAPEMEILYFFEQIFPSKAIGEKNASLSVFDVIDSEVDKTIPNGAKLFEGEEPPEAEGYVGLTIFDDNLVRADGMKIDGPVKVWVKKSDMIPDFSSFTGKMKNESAHHNKNSQYQIKNILKSAQKAAAAIGSKAAGAINQTADKFVSAAKENLHPGSSENSTKTESQEKENIQVEVLQNPESIASTDYEKSLFEISNQLEMLSSQTDKWDYFVAVASGLLCGMTDILWVGDFDLSQGRNIASDQIDELVKKTAKICGCKSDDLKDSVAFLEKMFPIPADGNTPDFGGGLQHHLRDFGHHPTIVGLIFSLLTQFTECSYGTDAVGNFIIVPVPEKNKIFIGKDVPDKIFRGTVIWFFHLISDIAGSSSTAGMSGGTGIPGPVLSLAKEISSLKIFKDVKVQDHDLSAFLSKVFNGTIFAKHDEAGKIIKESVVQMDFRGEYGALIKLGKQAVPVIANDVIVRTFYFIRRLSMEIKRSGIQSFADLKELDWKACKPFYNPTIDRMLTIATGVFTSVDLTGAVLTKTYWVSVNYVGLGRFTVAIGKEMINFLRIRDVKKIKKMYEQIQRNTFSQTDNDIYERIGRGMNTSKFGLTLEETEILYNIELYKTMNDVTKTILPVGGDQIIQLKNAWISDWKNYMEKGFPGFTGQKDAVLHWYSKEDLLNKISDNNPKEVWFRLVLLEAMLFEPYYPLSLEKDKSGKEVPSKKYRNLQNPLFAYKKTEGDKFLENLFAFTEYYQTGYIKRLRRCYDKVLMELNEVQKTVLKTVAISAGVTLAVVVTAGMFAPAIAVALVGSNFAGLSGAALTSACLAYIGGGAIAFGGTGMAGGLIAIVGGGAILGAGVGAGVGGAAGAAGLMGKQATILQSAKLMVSVREIFLNDEHDIAYSDSVYEQYVRNIEELEKGLVDLRLKANTASGEKEKALQKEVKNAEESVHAMEIAMKSMNRYLSSFKVGMGEEK